MLLSRVGEESYPRKDNFSAHTHPRVHTSAVCTDRDPHSHRNSLTMPAHACRVHMRTHFRVCCLVFCQNCCTRRTERQGLFLQGTAVAYLLEHKIKGQRPLGPQLTQSAEKAWFLRFSIWKPPLRLLVESWILFIKDAINNYPQSKTCWKSRFPFTHTPNGRHRVSTRGFSGTRRYCSCVCRAQSLWELSVFYGCHNKLASNVGL